MPVQVTVYVLVEVGVTDVLPEVALFVTVKVELVQEVAFVELHVSVEEPADTALQLLLTQLYPLLLMVEGLAVRVTVGGRR